MPKKKISKSELKLKEMQKIWKITHYKPKQIIKKRNVIDKQQDKINSFKEIISAINKLADEYPANISNKNSKIWRPFEV